MSHRVCLAGCLLLLCSSTGWAQIPQIEGGHPKPLWSQPLAPWNEPLGERGGYLFGPDEPSVLIDDENPLVAGGWTQVGYVDNSFPFVTMGLPRVEGEVQLQQQWFFIEKQLDTTDGNFDWGFRADFMYGSDYLAAQAYGGPLDSWDSDWVSDDFTYGSAIPQLYLQAGYGDLNVKFGHFITPMGYETTPAPYNFFFTRGLVNQSQLPFTHSGVLAEYAASESLTLFAGWVAGFDTGFTRNSGSNFLGGLSLLLTEDLKLSYMTAIGDQGFGNPISDTNAYQHSIILTADLTDRLRGVLHYFLWDDQAFLISQTNSLANYYYYSINDALAVGVRGEWLNNSGFNQGEVTLGLNWKPHPNVTIRPEIRRDYFEFGLKFNQFATDLIITY